MQTTQVEENIGDEIFKGSSPHREWLPLDDDRFLQIASGTIYTWEELEYFDHEEKMWRESQPHLSFYDLLEIYGPQCYPAAKRGLLAKIAQCNADLRQAEEVRQEYNRTVLSKVKWANRWFYVAVRDQVYCAPLEEGREATIKRCAFYLGHIRRLQAKAKGKEIPTDPSKITDADIAQAKEIPVESLYVGKLVKMGGRATGQCPFHNEKTGSFTIYLKQNKWYCYGCHEQGDVIDFVSKSQRVDFLTAVKILLKRI